MVTRLAATAPEEAAQENAPGPPGSWSIDRRIPLALIAALIAQTLSLVCWAVQLSDRVALLEAHDAGNMLLIERSARMEERLSDLKDAMQRVENRLDAQRRAP
jgi:hypothetical protein